MYVILRELTLKSWIFIQPFNCENEGLLIGTIVLYCTKICKMCNDCLEKLIRRDKM